MIFVTIALMIQGALKDGVTTWVPTYLNETYSLGSVMSILGTMIIPLFNLLGVYLSDIVNRKIFKNELKTSALFFVICSISMFLLWGSKGSSPVFAIFLLTVATTSMMGVNTMLIAVLPSYFGKIGCAASVSGILNSSVYMGGAASTYGIGALSNVIGWQKTILVWGFAGIVAVFICILCSKRWKKQQIQLSEK